MIEWLVLLMLGFFVVVCLVLMFLCVCMIISPLRKGLIGEAHIPITAVECLISSALISAIGFILTVIFDAMRQVIGS